MPTERKSAAGKPKAASLGKDKGSESGVRPAGQGGPGQQAGGPKHKGGGAHEDKNP